MLPPGTIIFIKTVSYHLFCKIFTYFVKYLTSVKSCLLVMKQLNLQLCESKILLYHGVIYLTLILSLEEVSKF